MATKNIHIPKLTRPISAGVYPRRRLFRMLDQSRKNPVIWICGPPGSGKTTLAGSYVESRRLRHVWYQVDGGDHDVASFIYYLGLAVRRESPRNRRPLPVLTPEYLPGLAVFTRRFFEEICARLKPPAVLVFDNFQKMPADAPFQPILRDAFANLPPGISAVLVSRETPPPGYARLRANRLLGKIGWKDLRLTAEEAGGIARSAGRGVRKPTAETVRQLQKRSDGWAAGLMLLLEKSETSGAEPQNMSLHPAEEIFDYFAGEIFANLDSGTQGFLLRSAFLSRMTADMAQQLTGQDRAGRILSDLRRRNCFTTELQHGDPMYEYHALFREFLLSRAKAGLHQEEIAMLQRTAAELLTERGQVEEAASLLRECGDREGLIRLILSQATSLASQGRFGTLEEWIRALPQNALEEIPWLHYWMGVCRMAFNPRESRLHFEQAYSAFRDRKDAPGTFLSWSGIIQSILLGFHGFEALDPMIAAINEVIEETGGFPSREIEERVTCSLVTAIDLTLGGAAGFSKEIWLERALSVARTSADISMRANALICLLHFHVGRDFHQAGIVIDMIRDLAKRPGLSPVMRLFLCWADAVHALMGGAYDTCMKAVTDGIDIADATGIHLVDCTLMGHGVLCSMTTGDIATAKDLLRKMAASPGNSIPYDKAFYHYLVAWMALREGEMAKSRLHSEQSCMLIEEVRHWRSMQVVYLQKAFLCIESGAEEEASAALASSRGAITWGKSDFTEFLLLLAEAFFLLRKGEEEKALTPLWDGLKAGREKGFYGVYQPHPGFLELITAKALEAGIEPEYVKDLIRKNRLVPGDDQLGLEHWPWPVKIRTLGGFEILLDGKPLSFSRKVQQKPLQMLKALIALGGSDVSEEQITDLLWPESEGDLAHQSFATTLRRLRVLLGDERAISIRDGCLSLDNRLCWTDVRALDRCITEADLEKDRRSHDATRHRKIITRILDLYIGPFLSGEGDSPAVVAFRERLRTRFLRCVSDCGKHLEKAGEWEAAITCYRKGLEVDDLAEEFYRGLMGCYGRLDRKAEAVSVYKRCRKVLSSHLGVDPSRGTEALYRLLITGSTHPTLSD
jgi:DNA-binding SARP family transcriptional activator